MDNQYYSCELATYEETIGLQFTFFNNQLGFEAFEIAINLGLRVHYVGNGVYLCNIHHGEMFGEIVIRINSLLIQ